MTPLLRRCEVGPSRHPHQPYSAPADGGSVELSRPVLLGAVLLVARRRSGRGSRGSRCGWPSRDDAAVPSATRVGAMTALLAALLAGSVELAGLRPATAALAWAAGAAVVLGAVDLAQPPAARPGHLSRPSRLRRRVRSSTPPCSAPGARWSGRSLAAAVAFAVGVARRRAVARTASGFGDVKLLGLLGLVLGWVGWGVLLAGVFLGLLTGALVSLVLLATRRAGLADGPPVRPAPAGRRRARPGPGRPSRSA